MARTGTKKDARFLALTLIAVSEVPRSVPMSSTHTS